MICTPFHGSPEEAIETRPVFEPAWTLCQGFSLLRSYPPKCGRPDRNPCSVPGKIDCRGHCVSGNPPWQLAGSEVLGGLTRQEQKQKIVELVGTCPEFRVIVEGLVGTWCDLEVARNRSRRRENISGAYLGRQNASTIKLCWPKV